MSEEELYDKIDSLFESLYGYREHRRKNRSYFIRAHFPFAFLYDDLSLQERRELLSYLERYKETGGRCCNAHNEFSKLMRSRRNGNKKSAWYKALKERMAKGEEVCVACGGNEGLTIDHILPISKGGRTLRDNVQVMCLECNMAKDNSIPGGMEAVPMRVATS